MELQPAKPGAPERPHVRRAPNSSPKLAAGGGEPLLLPPLLSCSNRLNKKQLPNRRRYVLISCTIAKAIFPSTSSVNAQPPTEQMAQMTVGNGAGAPPGGAKPQQERRGPPSEPRTRPDHITDKRGTSGSVITLRSNFVTLRNRPNCAIYQYNVSYSPPIESRGLRCGLLRDHESLIGNVRAFDGMILYLPHRLPDDVTEVVSTIQRDNSQVNLKITLTNEVAANSPVSLQLFNVLFRKYVQMSIYLYCVWGGSACWYRC